MNQQELYNAKNYKIARFMDLKHECRTHSCDANQDKHFWYFDGVKYRNDELRYHYNWGWLMTVVDKIESIGYIVHMPMNNCTIQDINSYTMKSDNVVYLNDHYGLTKIDAVYQAVCTFIEWFSSKSDCQSSSDEIDYKFNGLFDIIKISKPLWLNDEQKQQFIKDFTEAASKSNWYKVENVKAEDIQHFCQMYGTKPEEIGGILGIPEKYHGKKDEQDCVYILDLSGIPVVAKPRNFNELDNSETFTFVNDEPLPDLDIKLDTDLDIELKVPINYDDLSKSFQDTIKNIEEGFDTKNVVIGCDFGKGESVSTLFDRDLILFDQWNNVDKTPYKDAILTENINVGLFVIEEGEFIKISKSDKTNQYTMYHKKGWFGPINENQFKFKED